MPVFKRLRPFIQSAPTWTLAKARELRWNNKGGVAAIVAILSPVLIGSMGLGGEAGYWYLTQRKVQNAADVAAHGAAARLSAGDNVAALESIANYLAVKADVDMTSGSLSLNNPPASGAYLEDANAIEIVVSETVPRMFSAMYASDPLVISARAVATSEAGGRGCIIALSPTAQGAISITGSASLTLTLCDLISNAAGTSFDMSGLGASVTANCVQTVGEAVTTANLTVNCNRLREFANAVGDPFLLVPEPALTGACQDGSVGQNNQTTQVTAVEPHTSGMNSMRFCNGLSLRGDVDLDPGLYMIEGGDFQINANASITGDGVVFYLADGVELDFNGTADLNVAAPVFGTYNGILFFGSRLATTASHKINGDAGAILDGAIYTPASHIDFQGNAGTSFISCTQVVTDTISFSGNGAINIHCIFPTAATVDVAGTVTVVE